MFAANSQIVIRNIFVLTTWRELRDRSGVEKLDFEVLVEQGGTVLGWDRGPVSEERDE